MHVSRLICGAPLTGGWGGALQFSRVSSHLGNGTVFHAHTEIDTCLLLLTQKILGKCQPLHCFKYYMQLKSQTEVTNCCWVHVEGQNHTRSITSESVIAASFVSLPPQKCSCKNNKKTWEITWKPEKVAGLFLNDYKLKLLQDRGGRELQSPWPSTENPTNYSLQMPRALALC